MRLLPHDVPSRQVRGRRATVHSRLTGTNIYYVTFNAGGLPEPAEFGGLGSLSVGQRVLISAEPELSKWWITL